MYARQAVLVGGLAIDPGDRFVFTVGGGPEDFQRAIVALPANAEKALLASPSSLAELGFVQLLRHYGEAGFGIYTISH